MYTYKNEKQKWIFRLKKKPAQVNKPHSGGGSAKNFVPSDIHGQIMQTELSSREYYFVWKKGSLISGYKTQLWSK